MPLTIRRASVSDAPVVVEFNRLLARESEGKALDPERLLPGVRAGLEDAGKSLYFLAEEAGEVLGQLAVTFEWSDWRNGWFWWVQSVYVVPAARRRGVFRALFEHLERLAREAPDVIGLRLYVENENRAAHQTYQRMGMKLAGYFVLEKYPLQG
ncbi:MAG: GNAT family N-acetyltransferase [Gemmataceae bacterium]|nr:GNAT family N-acetyltransferase [Gemmataceae bacterium]